MISQVTLNDFVDKKKEPRQETPGPNEASKSGACVGDDATPTPGPETPDSFKKGDCPWCRGLGKVPKDETFDTLTSKPPPTGMVLVSTDKRKECPICKGRGRLGSVAKL